MLRVAVCSRRDWLRVTGLAIAAGVFAHNSPAQEGNTPGVVTADLRDQLVSGLKAQRDEQKQFIDRVIARVEQKQLTVAMVKSIFTWARQRNPRYPFPHFERGMRIIADRYGVNLNAT